MVLKASRLTDMDDVLTLSVSDPVLKGGYLVIIHRLSDKEKADDLDLDQEIVMSVCAHELDAVRGLLEDARHTVDEFEALDAEEERR